MSAEIKTIQNATRSHLRPMEIVQRTGLSKTYVMTEIYKGHLRGYKVGRAWLVPVEEVDRWIRGEDEDRVA